MSRFFAGDEKGIIEKTMATEEAPPPPPEDDAAPQPPMEGPVAPPPNDRPLGEAVSTLEQIAKTEDVKATKKVEETLKQLGAVPQKLAIFLQAPTAHGLHSLVQLSDVRTLDSYVRALGADPIRPKSKLKKQLEDALEERVETSGKTWPQATVVRHPRPNAAQPSAVQATPSTATQQSAYAAQQQMQMQAMQAMMGRMQVSGQMQGAWAQAQQMPMWQQPMMRTAPRSAGYVQMAGDWQCKGCGYENWARNVTCKQCGQANPNPSPMIHSGAGYSWKPGDWKCGKCNYDNWAKNPSCKQCGAPNLNPAASQAALSSAGIGGYGGFGGGMNSGAGYAFRPGDWKCNQCGYDNWASRPACNSCGAGRQAGGAGGMPGMGFGAAPAMGMSAAAAAPTAPVQSNLW